MVGQFRFSLFLDVKNDLFDFCLWKGDTETNLTESVTRLFELKHLIPELSSTESNLLDSVILIHIVG